MVGTLGFEPAGPLGCDSTGPSTPLSWAASCVDVETTPSTSHVAGAGGCFASWCWEGSASRLGTAASALRMPCVSQSCQDGSFLVPSRVGWGGVGWGGCAWYTPPCTGERLCCRRHFDVVTLIAFVCLCVVCVCVLCTGCGVLGCPCLCDVERERWVGGDWPFRERQTAGDPDTRKWARPYTPDASVHGFRCPERPAL